MPNYTPGLGITYGRRMDAVPSYSIQPTPRSPLLEATSAATFPGIGTWTSIYDSPGQSVDDTFFGPIRLPFLFPYNGVFYHEVYISSNGYLTFGGGSSQYLSLTLSSPLLNKIYLYPGDMRLHRCYIKQAAEDNIFYIRLESTTFNGGTAYGNSTTVVEVAFYSPATGAPLIEIISGVNNVVDSNLTGLVGSTNFLPGGQMPNGLTANRSCVYVGDATGSNWTFYDNSHAFVGLLIFSVPYFDTSGYSRILKKTLGSGFSIDDLGGGVKALDIEQVPGGMLPIQDFSLLTVPGLGQLTFGTQDFSIEFFSRMRTTPFYSSYGQGDLISCGRTYGTQGALIKGGTNSVWRINVAADRTVSFIVFNGYENVSNPYNIPNALTLSTGASIAQSNVWRHYAITRVGNTITLYVNGLASASATVASNFSINNVLDQIVLGGSADYLYNTVTSSFFTGLRVCIGSSAYSGNFTPVSLPVVIPNTRLLMDFGGTAAPGINGTLLIQVVSETPTTYATNNNGQVVVTPTGLCPSYTITCTDRAAIVVSSGQTATFTGYDSTASVTVTITTYLGTYNFGPYTIGYDVATQNYNITF